MNELAIDQYLRFMFDYFNDDSRMRGMPSEFKKQIFLDHLGKSHTSNYIKDNYLNTDIARMAYIYKTNRIETIEYVLSNPNDALKELESYASTKPSYL